MMEINYPAKQAAVKKAAEEVTRALKTISDVFTNFQDEYLALLQDNESLRSLLKKPTPPTSRELSKFLRHSPKKKSPKSPHILNRVESPVNSSQEDFAETPGIVETTQFPPKLKPTPLKGQRQLQPKKSLFSASTSSKNSRDFRDSKDSKDPKDPKDPKDSTDETLQWPSTSQIPKNQSQNKVLSLSKRNVSTRVTSSGKIEKQAKLVFQPVVTKADIACISTGVEENSKDRQANTSLVDSQDLDIDATLFDKAFTQEDREVIESSPHEVNPRRKGRFRLKRQAEAKKPKPIDDIVLSDFDDDLELTQLEKEAVTQSKIKEGRLGDAEGSKAEGLVENMDVGQERKDMDETYFPLKEINAGPLREIIGGKENTAKRKLTGEGPSGLQKPPEKLFDMDVDGDWDADVSMDKWACPPAKLNSFDVVPRPKSPTFAFKGPVVRNKAERAKLKGWSCRDCQNYYENMNLTEEELQKRMNTCSRHRSKHNERYNTPPGFWNPVFDATPPSQQSIRE